MSANRQVFLSHSSVDAALARRLTVDLIDLGADVWLDQLKLGVGERFVDGLEVAVDQTDLMLVLVSEQSLASGWVEFEWRRLGVAGGNVVPVRIVDCRMPDELASQAYVDLAGGAYWNGVAQIAQRIGLTDVRPPVVDLPEVLSLSTPVKVELGSAFTTAFEALSETGSPAEVATSEMRARIHQRYGVQAPGIRYVGEIGEMPPQACLISVEDVPRTFFEVEDVTEAVGTIVNRVEAVIIAHLDCFIDPDLSSALYDAPYLAVGGKIRATTGELTAIFREAARQGLHLADLSALDQLLPVERAGPLDTVGIAEDLRPYQARRLSQMAALGGEIRALTLDPALESYAEGRLTRLTMGTHIDLPPAWADAVWQGIRARAKETGASTLIVEQPVLRGYFQRLQMDELTTLARRDLHADAPLRILGTVALAEDQP